MLQGLIGRKVGMTQVFTEDGEVIPVTRNRNGSVLGGPEEESGSGRLHSCPARFRGQQN